MTRLEGHKDLKPVLLDAKWSIYGGSYSGQKVLVLERFHGHISKQNGRFMGGLTRDKKSYLAPFSRYLYIYEPNYDFMHMLNISTSAGPRTFPWTYFEAEWSIYGGSYSGQKVVSRTV
eukprot:sb/3476449/